MHILSDSLAGEDASALVGFYYTGLRQQCILTAREEIPRQTFSNKVPPFGCRENGAKFSIILSGFEASERDILISVVSSFSQSKLTQTLRSLKMGMRDVL